MPAKDLFPEIEPYDTGFLPPFRTASDVLRAVRQPKGRPGGVPAWRAGRRRQRHPPPVLRPRLLPHRDLRPARQRPVPPAGRDQRQHHAAPDRRHGEAARAPRHRPLVRVRRLLGLDPGAGLCRVSSGAGARPGAARHLPVPQVGDRLVPLWPARVRAGGLARLRRPSAGERARRPAGGLLGAA